MNEKSQLHLITLYQGAGWMDRIQSDQRWLLSPHLDPCRILVGGWQLSEGWMDWIPDQRWLLSPHLNLDPCSPGSGSTSNHSLLTSITTKPTDVVGIKRNQWYFEVKLIFPKLIHFMYPHTLTLLSVYPILHMYKPLIEFSDIPNKTHT